MMRMMLLTTTVLALAASPTLADSKKKGKGGARHSYSESGKARGFCPPGLAKKTPACIPPGQAKKSGGFQGGDDDDDDDHDDDDDDHGHDDDDDDGDHGGAWHSFDDDRFSGADDGIWGGDFGDHRHVGGQLPGDGHGHDHRHDGVWYGADHMHRVRIGDLVDDYTHYRIDDPLRYGLTPIDRGLDYVLIDDTLYVAARNTARILDRVGILSEIVK